MAEDKYFSEHAKKVSSKGENFTNIYKKIPQKGWADDSDFITVRRGGKRIGFLEMSKGDVKSSFYYHKKGTGGGGGSPVKFEKREGSVGDL